MKTQKLPTGSNVTVLRQLGNYIPSHLVPKLARETGVEDHWRTFSPWSHVVSLSYGQLAHSIGLEALVINKGIKSILGVRLNDIVPVAMKRVAF